MLHITMLHITILHLTDLKKERNCRNFLVRVNNLENLITADQVVPI